MIEKLGFVGVGELALYTIEGLRNGGFQGSILLSPRNRESAAWLAANRDCTVAQSNQAVVDGCSHLFLATRPADSLACLDALSFRVGQTLVSVVAGQSLELLGHHVDTAVRIVRAMPVSAARAGASPTLVCPPDVDVAALFEHCGEAIEVEDESAFALGSVLACVYCWNFTLFETLIEATQSAGLSQQLSSRLVVGMARGAAELALANPATPPGEIAEAIATEGTFSKQGLDLLKTTGAFDPWRQAFELLEAQLTAPK